MVSLHQGICLVTLQFDEQKMNFFDSRDFKKEHTLIDQILSSN